LGKLHGAKIARMLRTIAGEVFGPELVAHGSNPRVELWSRSVLTSFSSSIAGGTDEIQKNIIGDRVLGLAREPAIDRDVPFRELRVGTQA
jgi:hypothetical protein